MATVPMSDDSPSAAPMAMPKETNLLMALADMHKQGRVLPTDKPPPVRKPRV